MACTFKYKGVVYNSKDELVNAMAASYKTTSTIYTDKGMTDVELNTAISEAHTNMKKGLYVEQNYRHGKQVTAREELVAKYGDTVSSIELVKRGIRTRTTRAKTWMSKHTTLKVGDYVFQLDIKNPTDLVLTRITDIYPNTKRKYDETWHKEGWVNETWSDKEQRWISAWEEVSMFHSAIEFETIAFSDNTNLPITAPINIPVDNIKDLQLPITTGFSFSEFTDNAGGQKGGDIKFSDIGKIYGLKKVNHYYFGEPTAEGNVLLTMDEIREGIFMAKRVFIEIFKRTWVPTYANLQGRNWFQVKNSDAVFAISNILNPNEVDTKGKSNKSGKQIVAGGTGTAVEMAIMTDKPVYVYHQATLGSLEEGWYVWDKTLNAYSKMDSIPILTLNFAGIGSRQLTENGIDAIDDLYNNTRLNANMAAFNNIPALNNTIPALNTHFAYGMPITRTVDDSVLFSKIFETNLQQEYVFRIMADTFNILIKNNKIKTIGEIEKSSDHIKLILLSALSNRIQTINGGDSIQFERFFDIYAELITPKSALWKEFNAHLNRYHGYTIIDIEDLMNESDDFSISKNYNDKAQFQISREDSVRSEIKNLFNSTVKVVAFKEELNIDYRTFISNNVDKTTYLGIPDTLQWVDYANFMFKSMVNLTTKEEMLNKLLFLSRINSVEARPLYAIYLQLKDDEQLLATFYTQFKSAQDRVILDIYTEVNDALIHKSLISNANTYVKYQLADKWSEKLIIALNQHHSAKNVDKSNTAISKFINEFDGYKVALQGGQLILSDFYINLSNLLTNIGLDITPVELEYLNTTNTRGAVNGLISSLFIPIGYIKTLLSSITVDDLTKQGFKLDQYFRLTELADKLSGFRYDIAGTTSYGANKQIRQSVTNPNFYSNWFSRLHNPITQQSFLKELALISTLQNSTWFWCDANSKLGMIYYDEKIINGLITKVPKFAKTITDVTKSGLTTTMINDENYKLAVNQEFIDRFEMVHFEGVKHGDTIEDYTTFDITLRMMSDLLAYYNNVDSKHKGLAHFSLKSNGDRGWISKVTTPGISIPTDIKNALLAIAVSNDIKAILFGKNPPKIFKAFKGIIEGDIREIMNASILLFGDKNNIVKLTNGKLTISPNVKLEKLYQGYHFKGYDEDGLPILLDEKGMPTGNVFKPRSLQNRTIDNELNTSNIIFAETKCDIFKHGAILTDPNGISILHMEQINEYVLKCMVDISKATINKYWAIKDKLAIVETEEGVKLFPDDTAIKHKVAEFALNDYIANNEQSQLWLGTPGEFNFSKDTYALDFVKRAIAASAFHIAANPYIGNDKTRTSYRTLTIQDIELRDPILKHKATILYNQMVENGDIKLLASDQQHVNIDKLITIDPTSKEALKRLSVAERIIVKELKAYYNIKISDGFSIMSYSEFKNRLAVFGISKRFTNIINKLDAIQKGDKTIAISTNEYNTLIESLKETYYHREYDPYTKVYKSKFVKDAKFVLLPGYVSSEQLRKLSAFMESLEIGELQFESANKMLAGQSIRITNTKGDLININTSTFKTYVNKRVQTNYYKNVGLQQNIHSVELDSSNKLGVQIMKIIWDNVYAGNNYFVRGEKYNGKQLFNKFGKIFEAQVQNSINSIIVTLGGKLSFVNGKWQTNKEGQIVDNKKLTEYVLDELIKQGVDRNLRWALENNDDGKPNVSIAGNMHRKKIISVIEALFTNRAIRQEMPGPHAVLISSAFTSDSRSYKSDAYLNTGNVDFIDSVKKDIADGKRTSKLQAVPVITANGEHYIKMEVVLSAWNKQFFKDGQIIDINDLSEEVRTLIGYRIPYEDKHSTMIIEVVGFIKSGSNQIYVPDEIIARAGIDFDIDTQYLMSYNTFMNKEGKIEIIPYLNETTDLNKRWKSYVQYYKSKYKDLIPDLITDKMRDAYAMLDILLYENIPFKGSDITRDLIKQRVIKSNELNLAKENNATKQNLQLLKTQINTLTTEILNDEAYVDYLDEVESSGKSLENIRKTREDIHNIRKEIDKLNSELDNIFINNGIIPTKDTFTLLSIEDQNTPSARQNMIVDVFLSVLKSSTHEIESQKPNVYDGIQDSKLLVDASLGEDLTNFDPNNYIDKTELSKRALQSRNLKGRAVAYKSLVSIFANLTTQIEKEYAPTWTLDKTELILSGEELIALYGEENVTIHEDGSATIIFSYIGNNRQHNGRNIANKNISSVIAEIVSNMFDAVKYPMGINLDGITLNTFSIMPSLGVSHRLTLPNGDVIDNAFVGIDYFIHQPIIRELTKELNLRSSTAYYGNRKGKEVYDIRMSYLTRLFNLMREQGLFENNILGAEYNKLIKIFDAQIKRRGVIHIYNDIEDQANSLFASKLEGGSIVQDTFNIYKTNPLHLKSLKAGIEDVNITTDYIKYQVSLLNNWATFDFLRKVMFDGIQVLTQDKDKYSIIDSGISNETLALRKNDKTLYTIKDGHAISVYADIYDNDAYRSLSSIKRLVYDVADEIIKPYVISEQPIVKRYLNNIFRTYNINNPDVRSRLSDYFINIALMRLDIFKSTIGTIKSRVLSIGEVELDVNVDYAKDVTAFEMLNLSDKIIKYKELHPELNLPIYSTHILNQLSIKSKEIDKVKNGYVRIEYAGKDNDNTLRSVFKLWNADKQGRLLVEDLIRYAFLLDDLSYGYNISKVIPYPILNVYGYTNIIEATVNTLTNAWNESQDNIVAYDLNAHTAQEAYIDAVISDIFFTDTAIEDTNHLIERMFQKEMYNQAIVPVLSRSKDKNGDDRVIQRQGVFIIKNDELQPNDGYYSKFKTNTYIRIKGSHNSNHLRMKTDIELFRKIQNSSDNIAVFKVGAKYNDTSVFLNAAEVNFEHGNILRISAPFNPNTQEREFVNVKVVLTELVDGKVDKVAVQRTLATPFYLEPLYKAWTLGDDKGVTFYYPISRIIPNEQGTSGIKAFQVQYSEAEYIHKIIPSILATKNDIEFDSSVYKNNEEHLNNLYESNALDESLNDIEGTRIDKLGNYFESNIIDPFIPTGATKAALEHISIAIQKSINTADVSLHMIQEDDLLYTIFEKHNDYYAKIIRGDLEALDLNTIRMGLMTTVSLNKQLIGSYDVKNLFDILTNDDPNFWLKILDGGIEHKQLMTTLAVITKLHDEFEEYSKLPDTLTHINKDDVSIGNRDLLTAINSHLHDIRKLSADIQVLENYAHDIKHKLVGFMIHTQSTNPDIKLTPEQYLLEEDAINELDKAHDDISFFTYWLNSPATTGSTVLSILMKNLMLRNGEADASIREHKIKLETVINIAYAVTKFTTTGLKNFKADSKSRAAWFEDGFMDTEYNTLIIKYKQEIHSIRESKLAELKTIALANISKGGEHSPEYRNALKDYKRWTRENYQQEFTLDYLIAKDKVDAILDSNNEAKDMVEGLRNRIALVTSNRDRSKLNTEELNTLQLLEQELYALGSKYKDGILKTGNDAIIADVIRAWETSRNEFYAKYHESIPNPEYEVAYNIAKNQGAEELANFFEFNTYSEIKEEFWDEYKKLADILYEDSTNARISEINVDTEELAKSGKRLGNHSAIALAKIKELEEERMNIYNADKTERIIKLTKKTSGDKFIAEYYKILNQELTTHDPETTKQITDTINKVNNIIISITDSNGNKHAELFTLKQLIDLNQLLIDMRDLRSRDTIEDMSGTILSEYRTEYDMEAYNLAEATILSTHDSELIDAWYKVFKRTEFSAKYLDELTNVLAHIENENKYKQNGLLKTELRGYKEGHFDSEGIIDGTTWVQDKSDALRDSALTDVSDEGINNIISNTIARIQRIHDIENLLYNKAIIYVSPVSKFHGKWKKGFWDQVSNISEEAKNNPKIQEYVDARNEVRDQIAKLLMPYTNSDLVYDATAIKIHELKLLKSLIDRLNALKEEYGISSTDEISDFIKEKVLVSPHEFEFNEAKEAIEAKGDKEYSDLWKQVFGQIDYDAYYKLIERKYKTIIINYLLKKKQITEDVNTPENAKIINDFIQANTIKLAPKNKELRDKYRDKNGEIDMSKVEPHERQTLDTYEIQTSTGETKIIYAKDLLATYKGKRVIRAKKVLADYRFEIASEVSKVTVYAPTKYYMSKIKELADKGGAYHIFNDLILAIAKYQDTDSKDWHNNDKLTERYRIFTETLIRSGLISVADRNWFSSAHTLTDTEAIIPKGYYMKSLPREGRVDVKANTLLWSDFAPREEFIKEYTDEDSVKFNDIAQFVPTTYYDKMLRLKLTAVGVPVPLTITQSTINQGLGSPTFAAWYYRNHVLNPYSKKWSPISIWTRLIPKHNSEIHEVPNKQFFGYGKLKNGATRTTFLDVAKTKAHAEMKKLTQRVTTPQYNKVKASMEAKYAKTSDEYIAWFNQNHVLDKFSGAMKPLTIWLRTTPVDEDKYYNHSVPMSHWNNSQPLPVHNNSTYEKNRNGYGQPTAKWLDPRWNAIKDNPFYQYLVSIVPEIIDLHPDYTKETGFIPMIPNLQESNKQGAYRAIGLGQTNSNIETIGTRNDEKMKIIKIPYMQRLNIKPIIKLDVKGINETIEDYETRMLNELKTHQLFNDDGTPFKSLLEIYAVNEKRILENRKYTAENIQYDPYIFMSSFIEHGIKYRTNKKYERERKIFLEMIKELRVTDTTPAGKYIPAKLRKRFGPRLANINPASKIASFAEWMIDKATLDQVPDLTTFEKILKVARVYTSHNYMTLNAVAAVGNVLQSTVMQLMEAKGGLFINHKNLGFGYNIYRRGMIDIIANGKVSTNNTKEGAIITFLNLQDVWDETGKVATAAMRSVVSKIADVTSTVVFFPMYASEHMVQNTMGIAMLNSHRIVNGKIMSFHDYTNHLRMLLLKETLSEEQYKNLTEYVTFKKNPANNKNRSDVFVDYVGEWLRKQRNTPGFNQILNQYTRLIKDRLVEEKKTFNTFTTVYDAFLFKDGRVELDVLGEDLSKEWILFRAKIRQVNNMMFGNYDIVNACKFEDSVYGQIALQFRKFIKPNWDMYYGNRFGKTQYNEFKNVYDAPAYATWFKFVTDPIRQNNPFSKEDSNTLKAVFNIFSDYTTFVFHAKTLYATFTPEEKAAIQKVNRQIAIMVITMLMISLLANMGSDQDKERKYATWYAIYQVYRLYTESFAFTPFGIPGQITQLMKSPTAATKSMQGIANMLWQTVRYPFISEESRLIHAGINADHTKIGIAFKKALPIKPIMMLSDIPSLVNYYKMIAAFDIDTKAD